MWQPTEMQKTNKAQCDGGGERQTWKTRDSTGRLNGLFSAAICARGEIHHRGETAGSSSTLQPLFYGADTATAAVSPSVTALTPPRGVAHKRECVCVLGGNLHISVRL